MREVILDTETTGLHVDQGDRIIEVACIELFDRARRGKSFQRYVNPEREISLDATGVHGITNEALRDKPRFANIADEFLSFIGEDNLVIHNGLFDLGFLNKELRNCGRPVIPRQRVVDTLELARRKIPGGRHSLDKLAERYRINVSARSVHGGLVDADILLEVYLELTESRQQDLGMDALLTESGDEENAGPARPRPTPMRPLSTEAERESHRAFLRKSIGEHAFWLKLEPVGATPPEKA